MVLVVLGNHQIIEVIASDGTVTLTNKEETVVMTLTLASVGNIRFSI